MNAGNTGTETEPPAGVEPARPPTAARGRRVVRAAWRARACAYDAAQQLLRDALARAVDAELDRRRAVEHGRGEHRHADGLAEAPGRADEHLLRKVLPRVLDEHRLVHLGKAARRLHLPEGARASLEEVLVELALVEAAVPARGVEERERVAALLHALHWGLDLSRALEPARLAQTRLQRRL